MSAPQESALASAVAYLGAVEVAPGRYAFPSKVAPRWFTCDLANIALCEPAAGVYFAPIDKGDSFFGCKLTPCVLMPPWWRPDSRFAWRVVRRPLNKQPRVLFTVRTEEEARRLAHSSDNLRHVERITADLNTGEEVPA